jgi:DNA helicase-2/ATP-dependent DNA helicase PcrA
MTTLNVFSIYQNLFENRRLLEKLAEGTVIPENMNLIMDDTILSLMNNFVHYEDAPAYLYLKNALEGIPSLSGIKHVVIDEAQDLNPIQYKIMSQLFRYSSMTILGDLNQSIHPYMNIQSLDILPEIFNVSDSSIFKLFRTYRSTREIVEFTKELLPESQAIEYINRPGDKPSVKILRVDWCTESLIAHDIAKLSEKYKSIAVICKTDRESRVAYKKLLQELKKDNYQLKINLIDKNSSVFITGIVVIPSYLSKGLEFDAVLVYDGSMDSYSHEEERKLFYTICTRAFHKLVIYSRGTPSDFINSVDKNLYEKSIL